MIEPRLASSEPGAVCQHSDDFDIEILRGHFFELDLFEVEDGSGENCIVGGSLQYGTDRITLDLDHARHLADCVRAAIDNAIAGTVISRPSRCLGSH